jgi:hypothetical protein
MAILEKEKEKDWATTKKEIGEGMTGFFTAPFSAVKLIVDIATGRQRSHPHQEQDPQGRQR